MLFGVYDMVDPVFLRGILVESTDMTFLFTCGYLMQIRMGYFQLYWLNITAIYRRTTKYSFNDRFFKAYIIFWTLIAVVALVLYLKYIIPPPVPVTSKASFIAILCMAAIVWGSSILILSISALKVFRAFQDTHLGTQKRAKKVTIALLVSLAATGVQLMALVPMIIIIWPIMLPSTNTLSPQAVVWGFFAGVFIAQGSVSVISLAQILSLKTRPDTIESHQKEIPMQEITA